MRAEVFNPLTTPERVEAPDVFVEVVTEVVVTASAPSVSGGVDDAVAGGRGKTVQVSSAAGRLLRPTAAA
jgi:hypothetical protein